MNAEGNRNDHDNVCAKDDDNNNNNNNKEKIKGKIAVSKSSSRRDKKYKKRRNGKKKSGYRNARGDAHRRYLTSALVRTTKDSRFSLSTLDPFEERVAGVTEDHPRQRAHHDEQPYARLRRSRVLRR
ncbi:hypothetical protein KPH14_004606 [Odynerus spinipes]|uniref:Uncharacterized protein n=1 Tax=Odynerus spinipes TaxID=1348599 RepID=A0AAD9VQF0_9HYME|nr:hypothetical protein KPH14_004606 [Odynerus spinipes]